VEEHEIGSDPILTAWNRGSVVECGGRDARRKALHRRHRFRAPEEDADVQERGQAIKSGVALTLAAALHDAGASFATGVVDAAMLLVKDDHSSFPLWRKARAFRSLKGTHASDPDVRLTLFLPLKADFSGENFIVRRG
jgi:hypothetical protein